MTFESKQSTYAIYGAGVIILIILVIYAFTREPQTQEPLTLDVPSSETASSTESNTSSTTPNLPLPEVKKEIVPTTITKPKTSGSANAYQKAVEEYQYRFQFANCKGNPGILTLKQGVKVMLDNRDAATHTFGFGGAKYTVKGYSFVIVTAPKAGTYYITCDGGGAAQMNVQK